MPGLSWAEYDLKSKFRGVNTKVPELLPPVIEMYQNKIPVLQFRLEQERLKYREIKKICSAVSDKNVDKIPEVADIKNKIIRLQDKLLTCQKELEGRDLGRFKRNKKDLHHTLYYIDLDAGNDGAAGTAIGTAWLTLLKYTSTTVRTAGDIAYVRANTTEITAADLNFDENGNKDDYLAVIGCDSVTNDPWSDGSDVKPSLSFGDGAVHAQFLADNYWWIERIVFKESADDWQHIIDVDASYYNYFKDCEITDSNSANTYGLYLDDCTQNVFDSCVFKDNLTYNVRSAGAMANRFISCTFDGGVTTTDYGIYIGNGYAEFVDCIFAGTTSHDTQDINCARSSYCILRNTAYEKNPNLAILGTFVFEEDTDGTCGDGKLWCYNGTVTKDTGVKTGNATFSNKLEPNTHCGVNSKLTLNNDSNIEFPYNVYCTSGVSKTITIKIRAVGTWGVYPTNAQLFIKFLYLDHAVNATRTEIKSTQVLAHASNWVDFTVTFTPLQSGIAYGGVYLGIYEDAGDGAYVNGEAA